MSSQQMSFHMVAIFIDEMSVAKSLVFKLVKSQDFPYHTFHWWWLNYLSYQEVDKDKNPKKQLILIQIDSTSW